jgi:hypothetical protein
MRIEYASVHSVPRGTGRRWYRWRSSTLRRPDFHYACEGLQAEAFHVERSWCDLDTPTLRSPGSTWNGAVSEEANPPPRSCSHVEHPESATSSGPPTRRLPSPESPNDFQRPRCSTWNGPISGAATPSTGPLFHVEQPGSAAPGACQPPAARLSTPKRLPGPDSFHVERAHFRSGQSLHRTLVPRGTVRIRNSPGPANRPPPVSRLRNDSLGPRRSTWNGAILGAANPPAALLFHVEHPNRRQPWACRLLASSLRDPATP